MPTDVPMPTMGYDMTEGTLVRWLKQPGDTVRPGEALADIETDKAVVEIESFVEGIVTEILVREGDTVQVGTIIARVRTAGEEPTAASQPAPAVGSQTTAQTAVGAGRQDPSPVVRVAKGPEPALLAAAQSATAPTGEGAGNSRLRISPVAARLAAERGIDPHLIHGTGPDGRILRADVEAVPAKKGSRPPAPQPAAPVASVVAQQRPVALAGSSAATSTPPSALPAEDVIFEPIKGRQTMARRMAQSKGSAPHYYVAVEVDMTEAQALRAHLNDSAQGEYRISVNDLISRACIIALRTHPLFNATLTEGGQIRINSRVNLGLAVALADGLIAPCLLDAARKSLIQVSVESRDLAERARANRLRPEEYAAGTFTISNLGMYGVDSLTAIINPPQTAILGAGRVADRAVARDGQVTIRQMTTVSLSADHRVTTGAEGAEFLRTLRETLENPVRLLI